MRIGALLSGLLVATALSCGDDESATDGGAGSGHAGSSGDHGGATGTDAGSGGGRQAGAGAVEDAGSAAAGTPVLTSAGLVVHGTMSLAWENPDSGCAMVEINRKQDDGEYAVAQTLTGEATSAEDMPGHALGTYCYTITCELGGVASSPSNEKCVTQ